LLRPEGPSTVNRHSSLRPNSALNTSLDNARDPEPVEGQHSALSEKVARQLLRRYGVVFRDLLARESLVQSWRDLLVVYRRLEMKGEVRGGRYVGGFTGEQFALPAAVEALRAVKRVSLGAASISEVRICASDPLNLVGVILPGTRVPAVPTNYIVFCDGVPIRSGTVRDDGFAVGGPAGQTGCVPAG
jgi:ATP-dependent Lhr-like helicase